MKKYLGFVALAFLLNGCDDGDMTVENIDFADVIADDCGNIIYKLKDSEVWFFEVESAEAAFANDATPEGVPRTLPINNANRIFYRAYNGPITSANICETIQPTTPSVIEQWTFTGNNAAIEITTTPVIVPNTDFPGGEKIQSYRHHIFFKNIVITSPGGSIQDDSEEFGFYLTPASTLPFNFDDQLDQCGNLINNTIGSEGIALDIDPALIQNATTTGTPRIGLISATTNRLVYSLFQSQVTADYFCASPTPPAPALKEQWIADDGVSGASGIVEVTTTSSGPGVFLHEIHLKNVRFRRGNSSFLLATDYFLGYLTTN